MFLGDASVKVVGVIGNCSVHILLTKLLDTMNVSEDDLPPALNFDVSREKVLLESWGILLSF